MAGGRITLLGGTGFIGQALARRLLRHGVTLRIVARHADTAAAPPGVETLAADVTRPESLRDAVADSDAVIYLPGIVREHDRQTFRALHIEAPQTCAAAARQHGAARFVFLSALGVRADAPAASDRSKAAGEQAVAEAFPGAIVVRPSLVYGPGDHFVSGMTGMLRRLPAMPVIAGGRTRFQPLHVADCAATLERIVTGREPARPIYDLAGPDVLTLMDILAHIRTAIGARCRLVPLPHAVSLGLAGILERLPGAPLTMDEVRLLRTDKVAGGRHPTPESLGVTPRPFAAGLADRLASQDGAAPSP